jgi:hypothetical protein
VLEGFELRSIGCVSELPFLENKLSESPEEEDEDVLMGGNKKRFEIPL